MGDSAANTLPWPGQGSRENSTTSETTPGGEQPVRWVVIRANVDPGEAIIIKSRLDSEGIPAVVQQEAVGTVLGLTVGPLGSARVLVPEPLAEQSLAILAETFDLEGDEEKD
jgi:hypothetical protein